MTGLLSGETKDDIPDNPSKYFNVDTEKGLSKKADQMGYSKVHFKSGSKQ